MAHNDNNQPFFFALLIFLLCFTQISFSNNEVKITQVPSWVTTVPLEINDSVNIEGSSYYLIADFQDNLIKKTKYRHFAIKILNSEGIQEMSDLNFEFDPSYQELHIHYVTVIRGGKRNKKLSYNDIQTFKVETEAERLIFNGNLSSVINLKDIRKGDIIEYAYSLIGFNPINNGNYSNSFNHQYTFPVHKIYNRIISPTPLNYKVYNDASEPQIINAKNYFEYIWEESANNFLIYDSNVPVWYEPEKIVYISNLNSWDEVSNWANDLFSYEKVDYINAIPLDDSASKIERINSIIKFVQDDIRYLGFEGGINSYKPHSSAQVLKNRYGDCKDKSQLLVSILRSEGIESYPVLINTELKHTIKSKLPSHNVFNHCIVYFDYEGVGVYVDPTISNQGGDIYNIYFPDYKYGLLIKDETTELTEIRYKSKNDIDISEEVVLDSINGSAIFKIKTSYYGKSADEYRSIFATNNLDVINQDYLNFYRNLYPNIESLVEPKIILDDRNELNELIIEENYFIPNFWSKIDDTNEIYCEFQPLFLSSLLNVPNTENRTMPYHLGDIVSYFQTTKIKMPEEWSLNIAQVNLSGENFEYSNSISYNDKETLISIIYRRKQDHIIPVNLGEYIEKHEKINNDLTFYFTYNLDALGAGNKISLYSVLIGILTLIIAVFFGFKIYKKYDPSPALTNYNEQRFGGWLILPIIGLTLSPFAFIYSLFTNDFFSEIVWIGATELPNALQLKTFITLELVINILLLIFNILIVILLYKKRTSTPRLISAFYIINFAVLAMDFIISSQIIPKELIGDDSESVKELVKSFIAICIWIPYFNVSTRVKNTFINTYKGI